MGERKNPSRSQGIPSSATFSPRERQRCGGEKTQTKNTTLFFPNLISHFLCCFFPRLISHLCAKRTSFNWASAFKDGGRSSSPSLLIFFFSKKIFCYLARGGDSKTENLISSACRLGRICEDDGLLSHSIFDKDYGATKP